jgi:chorismate synthase
MRRLRLITAGESHGPGLTATLLGLPAGLEVDFALLARDLARRQHGHGRGRRMQIESDAAEIRGGVRAGVTLGSPLALWIANRDYATWERAMSPDPVAIDPRFAELRRLKSPRPGHADLAGGLKYLHRDLRDVLERASARETAARVAAGAFAKMLLADLAGVELRSGVRALGAVGAEAPPPTWEDLLRMDDGSPLRAANPDLEPEMMREVERARDAGDTLGGAVTVIAHGVPPGLGSHTHWDEKLDGRLAQAVMSVPAVKAVEIGAALAASRGLGSAAHDPIALVALLAAPGPDPDHATIAGSAGSAGSAASAASAAAARGGSRFARSSNHAGGLEGGITNGEDVVVTAYKKPIATLRKGLPSVDLDTMAAAPSQYERSDVTALPAAGVIAEAMVALVLADALLEKLGGDSMTELRAHFAATLAQQHAWPAAP